MKKVDLIETLESSHGKMLNLLDGIPIAELIKPGASGDWSAKDVLSHLLIWEAETIKLLYAVKFHRKPDTAHFKSISDDEQNKIWYEQFKDRPYERVWDDYTAIRDQLIERIDEISETDLNNPGLFPWLKGQSLSSLIQSYILDHEGEHTQAISAWRASRTG